LNQKLSDWAAIAEIVSGIAVVITLIFLTFGIRENTAVTRAAAFDRKIEGLNQVAITLARDEELMRLFQYYQDDHLDIDELSNEEWARVRAMVRSILRIYETAYYSTQYGTLGLSEWSRFERQICRHRARLDIVRWNDIQGVLTEEFANYVAESCKGAL
jgi:hypothetical protein